MPVFTKLTMLGAALESTAQQSPQESRQEARGEAGPVVRGRHGWLFYFRGQVLHTVRVRVRVRLGLGLG